MPNESISHCGVALSACLWLIKKKKNVGRGSSNWMQAYPEEAFPQSCVCLRSIWICFMINSYRKWSQVGTAVPELEAQRGQHKAKEVRLGQSFMWSTKESLRWLTASKPPFVIKCKTHMQRLIHTREYVLPTLQPTSFSHTNSYTHFTLRTADERKLMLDQCLVQEADLALWLVWLASREKGSEKVNEGLIYWFRRFFSAISSALLQPSLSLFVWVGTRPASRYTNV